MLRAYETFGNERAIEFTVMATPEDLSVNADYIRMADKYVEVPGGSNNNNYANVPLIVDIAERMGVHAVWAGWGHASENPRLPESLARSPKKIVFIGPPGSAMRSLGDKISSTIVAQSAQVPCVAWSGTGVDKVDFDENGIVTVSDEVYQQACTDNPTVGLERAEVIGFPVMIKASEGGGGKGIRKVENPESFASAFAQVQGEVPGSPIFIMKLQGNARHLEVQLLADQYGNNISLFGRDCSVQRRHQKIIEEAPVTIARPETFQAMEKAAVRLGRLVGYVSAGTVEYLYSHGDDKFYFLELNPRLQVEHPTTEMITGVNLPAAQLQIAMGIPLSHIRDIRLLYGLDPSINSTIDFEFSTEESRRTQRRPTPKGHTTACRITSEDPGAGFKPSSGMMHELNFRSSSNVWGYFSVGSGGAVHQFADSQFGHIFAYGENRSESRKHMVVALKELSIRGDFRTTVEYLIKLLETPAFEENTISTGWLDNLISNRLTAERPDPILATVCGAVVKAHVACEQCVSDYIRSLERGQVPSIDTLKTVFPIDFIYEGSRYRFTATRASQDSYHLFINGSRCTVGVRALSDGGMLILLDGASHTVYWREEVGATRLSVDSKTCILEQESDPTQLRSPSPGKLVRYLVESGDHVLSGQAYAEIEVMKMYMPLIVAEDGAVQLIKQPGATLEAGDILGILTLDDSSKVKHAKPFEGQLPPFGPPTVIGNKAPQKFDTYIRVLKDILMGFDNQIIMASSLKGLQEVLEDNELPYGQWDNVFAALHARMPNNLADKLTSIFDKAHARNVDFPAKLLQKTYQDFLSDNVTPAEAEILRNTLEPLAQVMSDYAKGLKSHEHNVFCGLLQEYLDVETLFSGTSSQRDAVILKLRDENKDNLEKVVQTILSHARVGAKNNLILAILELIKPLAQNSTVQTIYGPVLRRLTELDSRFTTKVSIKAREVLIQTAMPSLEERSSQMEHILRSSVVQSHYGDHGFPHRTPDLSTLRELIDSRYNVFDVLPIFFHHSDPWVSLAAMETYVRRSYRAYSLFNINYTIENDPSFAFLTWEFQLSSLNPNGISGDLVPQSSSSGFRRVASVSDMSLTVNRAEGEPTRKGAMVPVVSLEDMEDSLARVLEYFPKRTRSRGTTITKANGTLPDIARLGITSSTDSNSDASEEVTNVLIISVKDTESDKDLFIQRLRTKIESLASEFDLRGLRRVTVLTFRQGDSYPSFYTFRGPKFFEDESIRHIEPALAYQIELQRLSNFHIKPIFTDNRNLHVYKAVGKNVPSDKRFFIRALVRPGRLKNDIPTSEYLISETDQLVSDILDALQVIGTEQTDLNHILINFTPTLGLDPQEVEDALGGFLERFGRRLWRLRVTGAEIRIVCMDPVTRVNFPLRVIITNVSGFVVKVESYAEVKNDKGEWIFKTISNSAGPGAGAMHLRPVSSPYPTKEWLQPKRYKAHIMGTTYVYDFPELFRQAIRSLWKNVNSANHKVKIPEEVLESRELILDEHSQLIEVDRDPGTNTLGMVAWLVTAKTPECPKGRQFVLIANDITYKIGSFGPQEDEFFAKVTRFAQVKGIPRVYLSANSGARIALADELIPLFSVAWIDPSAPEKGFDYLYFTPKIQQQLEETGQKEAITEKIVENGEVRYKIVAVIGAEDGLGVENLRGSGLIAGVTSRAYEDIFTITLVTCRSVGIGAYLTRLGQRTVQVEGQPIILTGASALNNVLGREVYSSNLQLGGTQIMYRNGVSHITAEDDFDGVRKIMEWMSFVPERKNLPIPIHPSSDSWDRDVEYFPSSLPYDVRWLLEGKGGEDGEAYQHGFFDHGSFRETLSGWAQSVVVGRARLGGIPIGVICVETRTLENIVPADPANAASTEQVIMEAGQVWYPNSAYKTAQAINDFNHGEQLPLIIFANWRGFSGGQRDMFNEILKYGSYIVDALTKYKQPVFVYIPPGGELRGGSWVVVDPTINEEMMEMYADEESRGGVLEPEGIVGIKFRKDRLLETMSRLDPNLRELHDSLKDSSNLSEEESISLKRKISEREKLLMPVYSQISIQFADLHDRAGRMKAKGVIREILNWRDSRRFFYWRLRRRLNEQYIIRHYIEPAPGSSGKASLTRAESIAHLHEWFTEATGKNVDNDREFASWLEKENKEIHNRFEAFKNDHIANEIASIAKTNKTAALIGFEKVLQSLSASERKDLLKQLA